MIINIYSVHDAKAKAYLQPFFMRTDGEALRSFQTTVDDPQSPFSQFPEDFTLFHLGQYDDSTGLVEGNQTPMPVAKALELKK